MFLNIAPAFVQCLPYNLKPQLFVTANSRVVQRRIHSYSSFNLESWGRSLIFKRNRRASQLQQYFFFFQRQNSLKCRFHIKWTTLLVQKYTLELELHTQEIQLRIFIPMALAQPPIFYIHNSSQLTAVWKVNSYWCKQYREGGGMAGEKTYRDFIRTA